MMFFPGIRNSGAASIAKAISTPKSCDWTPGHCAQPSAINHRCHDRSRPDIARHSQRIAVAKRFEPMSCRSRGIVPIGKGRRSDGFNRARSRTEASAVSAPPRRRSAGRQQSTRGCRRRRERRLDPFAALIGGGPRAPRRASVPTIATGNECFTWNITEHCRQKASVSISTNSLSIFLPAGYQSSMNGALPSRQTAGQSARDP